MKYIYILLTVFALTGCIYEDTTYGVYYHNTGAASGEAPTDSKIYTTGEAITLLGSGTLENGDNAFLGWQYDWAYSYDNAILIPGNKITMQYEDINLFPVWDDGLNMPFIFKIENGEAVISGFTEYNVSLVAIPATLQGKPVTTIDNSAFSNLSISKVALQKNLKHIGFGAFAFNDITFISLPSSVETIGVNAFAHNALNKVIFAAEIGLREIPSYAFADNELIDIIIPSGVTTIGEGAFDANELNQITIGAGVTIEDDTSLGVNGASFRALYDIEKKAGLYVYTGDGIWKQY
jgi:hypothetical protein